MRGQLLKNGYVYLLVAAIAAAELLTPQAAGAAGAEVKPAVKARPSSIPKDITDEEVVGAMRKGVDYLLSQKNGDTWEGPFSKGGKFGGNRDAFEGGETALVVYALLHVGESSDDPRLNYKSTEMAGAIKFLYKMVPLGVYAAGLQANALALVPKNAERDAAFSRTKDYLLTAMGHDGGYDYAHPHEDKFKKLEEQQDAYRAAQAAKQPEATLETMKRVIEKNLVDLVKTTAGGGDPIKGRAEAQKSLTTTLKKLSDAEKAGKKEDIDKAKVDVENAKKRLEAADGQLKENFLPIGDLSNGQYGTLGAWALQDTFGEMPMGYWNVSDRFWRLAQQKDGGWAYKAEDGGKSYDAMSYAGIASLFITSEFTDTEVRLEPRHDKNIEMGLKWLTANFTPNRSSSQYALYGAERVGLASGLKFFGTTNWYKGIAKSLLNSQKADGSWTGGFWGGEEGPVATAYALLVLARGRNAVVFNKLEYNGPWDARPRDNANVTHWMSKQFERPINWQVVNLQVSPDEWLDAPMLLITGSKDPKFSAEDIAKLKAFVNAGGIVFSTADGAREEFTAAMRKVAAEVVDKKYEMRELPKDHPAFNLWKQVKSPPRVLGMSNGVREVWVHSTVDMGASWQRHAYATEEHFVVPSNLYFYATGKGSLRSKLQSLAVTESKVKPVRSLGLQRVQFAGNWDPEPGAWPRMAKIAQADFKMDLQLGVVKLADLGTLDAKKVPIVHMTGTGRFPVNAGDGAPLKAYLGAGGMIFIDAAGGNTDFMTSALALLTDALPESSPQPMPANHVILTGKMPDGEDITSVEYRKLSKIQMGGGRAPRLLGIEQGGRYVALVSQDDVTSGLLGTNTWGILGYAPESALSLVQNVLLYAADPKGAEAAGAGGGAGTQAATPAATKPGK